MHVAKAIIYDADGDILILRRSGTHPHYAYQPDLPGGEVEPHEDPITGLIREIEEEAGITIHPDTLEPAFQKPGDDGYTRHLYIAKLQHSKPDIIISWEHDQYTWMPPHKLIKQPTKNHTDSYYIQAIEWLKPNL